eukprot:4292415-Ditylum_brightwellii.AAC.1
MEDLLLVLRQFKNLVRWKEYWRLQRAINNKTTNKVEDVSMASSSSDESINSTKLFRLGTNLCPLEAVKRAPSGLANLDKFLHRLESDLLELDNHYKQVPLPGKDNELAGLFRQLKDEKVVVVPMDKTNNYVT